MMIEPEYLSKKAASVHTGLSQRTLDYARSAGELPFYLIGRRVIFSVKDLTGWVESHRVDATQATTRIQNHQNENNGENLT